MNKLDCFKCGICDARFKIKHHLKKHKKLKHKDKKTTLYSCDVCFKHFLERKLLSAHKLENCIHYASKKPIMETENSLSNIDLPFIHQDCKLDKNIDTMSISKVGGMIDDNLMDEMEEFIKKEPEFSKVPTVSITHNFFLLKVLRNFIKIQWGYSS